MKEKETTTSEKVVMFFAVPIAIMAAFGIGFLLLLIANMLAGELLPFQLSGLCFDRADILTELICDITS